MIANRPEMVHPLRRYVLLVLCIACGLVGTAHAQGTVLRLDIDGAIGVATAEYVIEGIDAAQQRNANLVIIRMDTPGGLVEPMRDIVQSILGSSVPVATYVSPGGARADSAGTYILLASHVAAMAPTTHLGAATPVSLGGDSPAPPTPLDRNPVGGSDADDEEGDEESKDTEETEGMGSAMERKVMNDAIAYIRGLAEAHGRNADWAELAVREAATLTATRALEENVIDLIATDQADLLEQIHGREVQVNNRPVTLDTRTAVVEIIEPSWRNKVLSAITQPEVALLLLLVGIYGLVFEGWNPGAIVPGVVGVISLLLAAYALQVLPVNYAGLALIVVGIALIVAEAFVPSFGALGLGGIAAFIFGAIMMFDTGIPGFGISVTFVVAFAVLAGLFLLWLVTYLVKLRRRGAVSGAESIVGGIGEAMESFTGEGRIWLEGEAWAAMSTVPIKKGQEVVVRDLHGLVLQIEPVASPSPGEAGLQT
jgi:membrane-bound serine protease (ClpP class)